MLLFVRPELLTDCLAVPGVQAYKYTKRNTRMAFFNCNKEEVSDYKIYYLNPRQESYATSAYATSQTSDTYCRLILLGNKAKEEIECLFVDSARYARLGMPKEVVQRLGGFWWGR